MWIIPQEAGALPTDKQRDIIMVYQCPSSDCGNNPPGSSSAWGKLQYFLQTTLAQNVTIKTSLEMSSYLASNPITNFDLVIWYNDYTFTDLAWTGSEGPAIAGVIKKAKIPTVVFDANNFYVTQKLGLIAEGQTGGTYQNPQSRMDAAVREADGSDWGDLWHPLVAKGSACGHLGCITPNPFVYDTDLTSMYTVDLSDDDLSSGSYMYTRPLYSAQEDGGWDQVTALVDDRRHIVSLGTRSTVTAPVHAGQVNIEVWRRPMQGYYYFLNEVVSYLMTPSPWTTSIGQNTFTETDWTTKSRGFDFQIKRTYSSGAKSIPLEPPGGTEQSNETNWWFNYNQYIVWDRFNDQIILYDETGQAIPMEMVQGTRPGNPGWDPDDDFDYGYGIDLNPRVFTTVNSPKAQVAIYYPPNYIGPETLVDPDLSGAEPSDPDKCTYNSQAVRNYVEHRPGFLVRDASGNKAFFAVWAAQDDDTPCDSEPFNECYEEKENWTRGNELVRFRLQYLEDANGNRQDYYYAEVAYAEQLVCIVDTEGRGYSPQRNFAPVRSDTPLMPEIVYDTTHHVPIGADWAHCPLNLLSVAWMVDGNAIRRKEYTYAGPAIPTDHTHAVLSEVYETDPAYPTSLRLVTSFEYEGYNTENYSWVIVALNGGQGLYPFFTEAYYPGRLTKTISDDGTKIVYSYIVKSGHPVSDVLEDPYTVTWAKKVFGVDDTMLTMKATVANGRQHVIKTHEAYTTTQWTPLGDPLAETPGACNTLPTGLDPTNGCPGWTREFGTNFDGQIRFESSSFNGLNDATPISNPKGRITFRKHLVDEVFDTEVSPLDNVPADDEMLAFWRQNSAESTEYWYLRFWLANEIETQIESNDGLIIHSTLTAYEPVFNKPVSLTGPDAVVQRLFRYDYLENGSPSADTMFDLTFSTFVNVPAGYPWPAYLSSTYDIYNTIGWITTCNRAVGDTYLTDPRGNVICEVLPPTPSIPDSTGYVTISARFQAATHYAYDALGREKYSRSPTGRVVETGYSTTDPTGWKTVTRLNGATAIYRTKFLYNEIGQITDQLTGTPSGPSDVSETGFVQNQYEYDLMGNQTDLVVRGDDALAAQRQEYMYDANGAQVAVVFERCPMGAPCGEFGVQENDAGDELLHVMAHDLKGRVVADCSERDADLYDCTTTTYDANDVVEIETKYQGCPLSFIDLSTADGIQRTLLDISSSCFGGEEKQIVYTYDGRLRLHTATTSGGTDPARTIGTWYNYDDMPSATFDAADSDATGGVEYSHYEYDGKGRLRRKTDGLDVTLNKGKTGVLATMYSYNDYDKVVDETVGIPNTTVGSFATNSYYGSKSMVYDARQAHVATKTLQYTVNSAPLSNSAYVKTYLFLDQENKTIDAVTRTAARGPVNKFLSTVHTDYDPFGRVYAVSDGFSDTSVYYYYDALDRVEREERYDVETPPVPGEGMSELYEYGYDLVGHKVWSANVNVDNEEDAHITYFDYDGYGYLVSTVDAQCQQTVYARDGRGNAIAMYERFDETNGCAITPPAEPWYFLNGGTEKQYYDEGGELAVLGPIIQNAATYDYAGNLLSRADDHGDVTTWTVNSFGEVAQEERPDGFRKIFSRNLDGAIQQIVYQNGGGTTVRTVLQTNDLFNRTKTVTVNGALMQTFTYRNNGLPNLVTDYNLDNTAVATSVKSVFSWDTLGNRLSDKQMVWYVASLGGSTYWTTTALYYGSHLATMTLPISTGWQSLGWARNDEGRLTMAWELSTSYPIAQFSWIGDKLVNKHVIVAPGVTLDNNREESTGVPWWNGFGLLAGQEYLVNGSSDSEYEYTYNANDRLLFEDFVDNTTDDVFYTLDHLGRVSRYDYDRTGDQAFALDEVDNLRQIWDPNVTPDPISAAQTREHRITANGMNQIESVYNLDVLKQSLTYDDFGNLVSLDRPGTANDVYATWDRMGRLIVVKKGGTEESNVIARFVYDAFGRRVSKVTYSAGAFTNRKSYHLYGDNVMEEHNQLPSGDHWLFVTHHEPGATDRYLRWDKYTYTTSWTPAGQWAPTTDIRNNVTALVNESGGVNDYLYYDLYGNTVGDSPIDYMPYRFAGREYDAETGLYYNRTRYYLSDHGRFVSADTIGIWGDLNNYGNGYAYVGGMVNGFIDPDGRDPNYGPTFGDRIGLDDIPRQSVGGTKAPNAAGKVFVVKTAVQQGAKYGAATAASAVAGRIVGAGTQAAATAGVMAGAAVTVIGVAFTVSGDTGPRKPHQSATTETENSHGYLIVTGLDKTIYLVDQAGHVYEWDPVTGKWVFQFRPNDFDESGGGFDPEDVHDIRNLLRRSHVINRPSEGHTAWGVPDENEGESDTVDDFFDPMGGHKAPRARVHISGIVTHTNGALDLGTAIDEPVDDFFNPRHNRPRGGRGSGGGLWGPPRGPDDMGFGFTVGKPELGTGGLSSGESMQGWLNRLSRIPGRKGHVDPPPFEFRPPALNLPVEF
jgi:RHS repeat-associated protein